MTKTAKQARGMVDLEDLGFYSSINNFDNEVEILQSRTLIRESGGRTGSLHQLCGKK